jgi:serine/threonine-protein kinase
VKIMSAGLSNDPEAVGRFNREAANASRIAHANVCAIYDFGETAEGTIYLAMEFIEGKSLTDFLHDTGPLPLPRAAAILVQACEGLQAAHDLGIVHRDLKPDNIMISTVRGRDVVKVVDFGIAKATGSDASSQKVTRTGLVVGTPEYMSPEQLTGDTLDGRSDIYSMGLVFYRMLTGILPFKSDSAQEAMIKRLTEDPAPLSVSYPSGRFPPRLQEIVNHALARSPMERYSTAAEFGRDVQAVAGTLTGTVDTDGATQTLRRMSSEAGTVPQTRIDPVAQIGRPSKAAGTMAGRPPMAPAAGGKRSKVVPIAGAAVVVLALAGAAYAVMGRNPGSAAVPPDTAKQQVARDTTSRPADTSKAQVPTVAQKDSGTRTNPNPGPTPNQGSTVKPVQHNPVTPANGGPKPGNPGGTAKPTVDLAALTAQVEGFMKNLDFVDDATQRAEGRQVGQTAYNTLELTKPVRAQAAVVVAQALMAEAGDLVGKKTHADSVSADRDRDSAGDWLQKAIVLDPKPAYQNLLDNVRNK